MMPDQAFASGRYYTFTVRHSRSLLSGIYKSWRWILLENWFSNLNIARSPIKPLGGMTGSWLLPEMMIAGGW